MLLYLPRHGLRLPTTRYVSSYLGDAEPLRIGQHAANLNHMPLDAEPDVLEPGAVARAGPSGDDLAVYQYVQSPRPRVSLVKRCVRRSETERYHDAWLQRGRFDCVTPRRGTNIPHSLSSNLLCPDMTRFWHSRKNGNADVVASTLRKRPSASTHMQHCRPPL